MKPKRVTVLCFAVLGLLALLPGPAQAADFPEFWTGPANGMAVYALPHGPLTVPYVVAHATNAQVDCTLVIYTTRGPDESIVASVPMGTVTAVDADFCNADGSDLPFSYTWTDVTLEPGSYRCRVTAFDGTSWATDDLWCYVQIVSAPDTTPPVTTTSYDGLWHRAPLGIEFYADDDPGGWGMGGVLAKSQYSLDGGETWVTRGWVPFPARKRGGGSGVYTLLYRSTDSAGNTEEAKSCQVFIDARPPITTADAPLAPQSGDVTVHLTAVDSMFGVTACSGLAQTSYRVDDGRWQKGNQVLVPAARNAGIHWIAYYSTDVAGNAECVKWCSVTIAAPPAAGHAARFALRR